MVRLREPAKPRPQIGRRLMEIAIVLGVLGVVAMNSWQAFGAKLWAKSNANSETASVVDDCVGGLCITGANAEATAAASSATR